MASLMDTMEPDDPRWDMPEATGKTPSLQWEHLKREIKEMFDRVEAENVQPLTAEQINTSSDDEWTTILGGLARTSAGQLIPNVVIHEQIDRMLDERFPITQDMLDATKGRSPVSRYLETEPA